MGHLGGSVFIRPDRGQAPPTGALVFHAEALTNARPLTAFWDLTALRDGYAGFIALFSSLTPDRLSESEALTARLLLVHAYRFVLLRDPRLPVEHLPADWNAPEARALFCRLYLALTPAAESHVAALCEGTDGPLPATTEASEHRRLALLSSL